MSVQYHYQQLYMNGERISSASTGLPQGADFHGLSLTTSAAVDGMVEVDPHQSEAYQAHCNNVLILTRWLVENYASIDQLEAHLNGKRRITALESEATRLDEQNSHFVNQLQTPEAQLSLARIRSRYKKADEADESPTLELKAALRLASAPQGEMYVIDYDDTITDETKIAKVDGVKPGHPGALVADVAIGRVKSQLPFKDAFIGAFPASFQPALRQYPQQFRDSGRTAPLREGVQQFFQNLSESEKPVRISSTNFELTIRGALERFPQLPENIKIWGITDDSVVSAEKEAVIQKEASENPDRAVIYIGDGLSDQPAVDARDQIAFFFALKGGPFEKQLQEVEALYFTYETFHDIESKLSEIRSKLPQASQLLTQLPNSSSYAYNIAV